MTFDVTPDASDRRIGWAHARRCPGALCKAAAGWIAAALLAIAPAARAGDAEAFGKAELDPRLREFLSGRGGSLNEAMDAAEGWIKRLRGPNPLVLVTHLPNIDALTGEQIDYNDAVVTESDEQGQLKVLGVLRLLP
ncbi:MAG: hypothetical protein ACK4GB_05685 [Tepidimonas sp.]